MPTSGVHHNSYCPLPQGNVSCTLVKWCLHAVAFSGNFPIYVDVLNFERSYISNSTDLDDKNPINIFFKHLVLKFHLFARKILETQKLLRRKLRTWLSESTNIDMGVMNLIYGITSFQTSKACSFNTCRFKWK